MGNPLANVEYLLVNIEKFYYMWKRKYSKLKIPSSIFPSRNSWNME
jgi:hypothetical protein